MTSGKSVIILLRFFFLLAERSFYGLAIFFLGGGPFSEKNGGRGGMACVVASRLQATVVDSLDMNLA